ncbi:MAG: zinc ribbon domain-containing protein [Candidatus Goldbacteria bacterium]|nr:zinc ribbon domain-containing protein [Candidatus Goldiibacteriota bacterium]
MAKKCKSCGMDNRDEAKFCASCGAPLSVIKNKPVKKPVSPAAIKFRVILGVSLFLAAAVIFIIMSKVKDAAQLKTVEITKAQFEAQDTAVFSGITAKDFTHQVLKWQATVNVIKQVYQYAKDSDDPDFMFSMMVSQPDFKEKLPHANFLSLGIYDNKLYAVKYEFGETEEYLRQVVKVPDGEAVLYGRYLGLRKVFEKLFGRPSFVKEDIKKYPLKERLKYLKKGKDNQGNSSNIYITWDLGNTKAELVMFGSGEKAHLTVRFLYMPVWDIVGKH